MKKIDTENKTLSDMFKKKKKMDTLQIKLKECYSVHEQKLTQHENKLVKIDQMLQEQKHTQNSRNQK